MIRAYVVDDEALAVKRLTRLLEGTGRVEVAGGASDPEAAVTFLQDHAVDVLFLDIHMPGLTGFEVLQRLEQPPFVVFTTAHDSYALQAFETNAVDYLLKPVEPDRLDRALDKIARVLDKPHFFSKDKLTFAVVNGREHVVDQTLSDLEDRLDGRRFVRIHRATIVNAAFVQELFPGVDGGMLVRLKDERATELSVARDRVRLLKERLGLL